MNNTLICHAQINPFLFTFEIELGVCIGVGLGKVPITPPHVSKKKSAWIR